MKPSTQRFFHKLLGSTESVFVFFIEKGKEDGLRQWESLHVFNNLHGDIPAVFAVDEGVVRFNFYSKLDKITSFDFTPSCDDYGESSESRCISEFSKSKVDIDLSKFEDQPYYKFLTAGRYADHLFRALSESGGSTREDWTEARTAGVFLKVKEYYAKYSDFGYDNYWYKIFADSSRLGFSKRKSFIICISPRGGDASMMLERTFEYFYDDHPLLLLNYDEMPFSEWDERGSYKEEMHTKTIFMKPSMKLYPIPEELLKLSCVLSKNEMPLYDATTYNRTGFVQDAFYCDSCTLFTHDPSHNGDSSFEEFTNLNYPIWHDPEYIDALDLREGKCKAKLISGTDTYEGFGHFGVKKHVRSEKKAIIFSFSYRKSMEGAKFRVHLSKDQIEALTPKKTGAFSLQIQKEKTLVFSFLEKGTAFWQVYQ